MFPSLGKPASGRRRHLSRDAANEVSSTPTSAHANARANSDSSTFYPALDAGFSAAANAAAGEQIQKALDSQLNQDTMVLDPSSHQPLDASSSAAANAAADEQTQRALDSQLHQNTMMVDPSYHPAPFAGSGSSSAAITPTVEQAPQGPDSWLIREGPMNMAFLENPFVDEVEGQYETVRRQNRRRGRGGRGQSYGRGRSQARGHFQSRGQVQGRGQVQDRGQSQGQVNQGGPTRLVIVGDYKEEDYLKSKAAMTAFIQEKRKRQRPVSDEIPVAMRPSARSTEEGNDMLDFVMLAPLGYHQVARPTGLIRAAIKVGNSEIIGNPFKSIKNYSVKVKLDDDRNGQASISLRFRINKSSRVEKREISAAGRRDPTIQQFECFSVNKTFPKSETEQALIKECGESELNRFTSINLKVLRVYRERDEPPSMKDLANSITDTNLLRTLQALLTELQAPLKLQI